jgi:Ni/Fe-hydrogenase subunit HybB-like protein
MKSVDELLQEMGSTGLGKGQGKLVIVFSLLVLSGSAAFLHGISGPEAARAWQAYLVNFVFWTGLAFGAVLLSAILTMTGARWGRPIKRLAEAPGAFLPVSFLLFWGLYFGKEQIFPWLHEPIGHKAAWLNTFFLFARDGTGLLILTALSVAILYTSLRGDQRIRKVRVTRIEDIAEAVEKDRHAQSVLSPVFALLYALVLSLIGFDLVMSLDPHWISTLFGAYFFIGSFYTGLAAVAVLAGISVLWAKTDGFVGPRQFHDLGKLLLGFCIVTGDFFYAQFLVIWYGNLPEETRYVILRTRQEPWDTIAWVVLVVCFVVPFLVLLVRRVKMKPAAMTFLGGLILCGMWLERFLLIAPSLHHEKPTPPGLMEIVVSGGFLGLVCLCLMLFFRKVSILPVSDPLLYESMEAGGMASTSLHDSRDTV